MQERALLELISRHAAVKELEAGSRILRQGDAAEQLLFVAEGEVELVLAGIPPVVLGRRGAGDVLGAEWVIPGKPAACDLVAVRRTRLLAISKEALFSVLAESSAFAEFFLRKTLEGKLSVQEAAGRLYSRSNRLEAYIARQTEKGYGELIGSSRAMGALRAELLVQAAGADPVLILGEHGVGKELVAAHIHRESSRKAEPFVVIRGAEWKPETWREKVVIAAGGTILIDEIAALPDEGLAEINTLCMRAAPERPRLIATVTERPGAPVRTPHPWSAVPTLRIPPLRDRKADIPDLAKAFLRELNSAYGATDEPISSEAMRRLIAYPYLGGNVVELRNVIQHAAHLASGGPVGPEHLRLGGYAARPGRPVVGVALGGGVVRGMAHIGVLQVLQAEGIPVDMVAGTSVGSLVGAVFAGGFDLAELERLAPTLSWPKLVGPIWPRDGMLTNAKLGAFLESLIGAVQIEDLPVTYAAVAVDRVSSQEVILRDGPVSTAVRASTAIPGLFAPIERDGRQLIDGGLVNNVPASVIRSMGADLVIAVDVRDYNYFNPGESGGLLTSFLRGYDIMIHRAAQSELEWADVPIYATKSGVNPYGFKAAKELIEAGREQAAAALPAIRDALRRVEARVG